jgi:hypothetical protein
LEILSLISEIVFVGLLIAAVVTIIKYPKDIIRGFFGLFRPELWRIGSWMFIPIWLLGRLIEVLTKFEIYDHDGQDQSEERYKSTKNLKFDFQSGIKYISINAESEKAKEILKDFLSFSYANISFEDFAFENTSPTLIKCPNNIPFYDYNLLVQHSNNEIGNEPSCGLFKSDEVSFYCYQDPATVHNIIGQTDKGQKFSVFTLDDLNKKHHIRLNNQIKVKALDFNDIP